MARTPADVIDAFVMTFVNAWSCRDPAPLAPFFADDAVYCNGPLPAVHGRAAIVENIGEFMRMGGEVTVDIVHTVVGEALVMVERVDHFTKDGKTISLPMAGVFELRDGVITAWRDYFDLAQFTSQLEGTISG